MASADGSREIFSHPRHIHLLVPDYRLSKSKQSLRCPARVTLARGALEAGTLGGPLGERLPTSVLHETIVGALQGTDLKVTLAKSHPCGELSKRHGRRS